jgi:putative transposase
LGIGQPAHEASYANLAGAAIGFGDSDWLDPLEKAVRGRVRSFIEQLLEEELEAALGRGRYERVAGSNGRHGHRRCQLVTTFGPLSLSVPRARLADEAGEQEWKSAVLPAYKRLSRRAEALIAETYLAGVNTRRVRRALQTLFAGHIGKDIVSRAWQRTRSAWEAWQKRDLVGDDIVRLILDGTVVRVRLDRRATAISLLIAMGIRRDGQKVVLAIKNMGGENEAAWRAVLDELLARGMAKPELVIVDGGKGLEAALASLWNDVAIQRCTVHKERNLLAHAPKHLHDQIKAEFNEMMHASTAEAVLSKRKAFLAKWKLRCRAVADSLEEADQRLFTFLRYPPEQWRSLRTTNAIERLHEEFKRRIKTQCLLPCAETAAMLFWALLASGQITMRRVDGWPTLDRSPADLDLAA